MSMITIQEAARILGISQRSIYTYVSQGKLTGDGKSVNLTSVEKRKEKMRPKKIDKIRQALEVLDLSERDRKVLEMRACDNTPTFAEIGKKLGISRQGAQLIIKRALDKLEQNRTEP